MNKTLKICLVTGALAAMTIGLAAKADPINLETTENLVLDAADIKQLQIDAGAGFLKVVGVSEASQISVIAELHVVEGEYKLSLERRGERALLTADVHSHNIKGWFGDGPRIDLTVTLPKALALEVNDGSGEITLEKLDGSIEINDGSGAIEARGLGADITIEDGSGHIEIKDVGGNLVIDDGSGGIEVYNIAGKVNIEDASGSILVEKAKGHVTIDDGSGGITVKDLSDGLTIVDDGSGGLSMKNVQGKVTTNQ